MSEQKDETTLKAYQAYQENARKSEALQEDIIRGAKAGESLPVLLLKAAEAISLMTDNDAFRREVELALTHVYGFALGMREPLEMELQATRERLEKITAAMDRATDDELRHGLDTAARAHRKRISELEASLSQ